MGYELEKEQINTLVKKISPIMEQFKTLQVQAKALGMFTNHRNLAECSDCQLFEDVTVDGLLLVIRGENYNIDTGLRFKELNDNAVQCPECGKIFCPYDASLYGDYHNTDKT